jgi:hypothetical protein
MSVNAALIKKAFHALGHVANRVLPQPFERGAEQIGLKIKRGSIYLNILKRNAQSSSAVQNRVQLPTFATTAN